MFCTIDIYNSINVRAITGSWILDHQILEFGALVANFLVLILKEVRDSKKQFVYANCLYLVLLLVQVPQKNICSLNFSIIVILLKTLFCWKVLKFCTFLHKNHSV